MAAEGHSGKKVGREKRTAGHCGPRIVKNSATLMAQVKPDEMGERIQRIMRDLEELSAECRALLPPDDTMCLTLNTIQEGMKLVESSLKEDARIWTPSWTLTLKRGAATSP